MRQGLIDTGRFSPDTAVQRLLFESALVDLPFGGVAEFDGQIAWPADPETGLMPWVLRRRTEQPIRCR